MEDCSWKYHNFPRNLHNKAIKGKQTLNQL